MYIQIAPFCVIIVSNIVLIHGLFREFKKDPKKITLSIAIILNSLAFIIIALPGEVTSAYGNYFKLPTATQQLIRLSGLSYNAFSPIVLAFSNKQLLKEMKFIFICIKKKKEMKTTNFITY